MRSFLWFAFFYVETSISSFVLIEKHHERKFHTGVSFAVGALAAGASDYYIDSNLITWQGDRPLISTRQSHTVQTIDTPHVMSTLSVFTSGKKNCHVLKGEMGAKLTVRASFSYGNYNGNDWPAVGTDMDMDYIYYEVKSISAMVNS